MDFNTTKPDTQNESVNILIHNIAQYFYNKNHKVILDIIQINKQMIL